MTEKEINDKLDNIRKNMRLIDSIVYVDYKTNEGKLTEKQCNIVRELFELFQKLGWQLSFNNYKELKCDIKKYTESQECGTPVKIRPCGEKYKNKTYFGIFLGEFPLSISHSIDKNDIVTASFSFFNPAIFVPELKKIIFGCESWWGRVKNEDELKELITDDTINNVWYVKMLQDLYERGN